MSATLWLVVLLAMWVGTLALALAVGMLLGRSGVDLHVEDVDTVRAALDELERGRPITLVR